VCAESYSNSIGFECTQCKGGTKAAIFTGVIAVLSLCVLGIAFLIRGLLGIGDSDDALSSIKHCSCIHKFSNMMHKLGKFRWGKLRIPIVAFQIVTQYISITGLPLPNIYRKFLSWTDVFNLNLGWLLSLGCLTQINFYQKAIDHYTGTFCSNSSTCCHLYYCSTQKQSTSCGCAPITASSCASKNCKA
jgi:hypothetical protein